jgi:uncharacterized protein (TIGR02996 family)
MNAEEAAFVAAIRAAPADDIARLVYADWLQEQGNDAWAALIRVQVELARPAPEQPASMHLDLFSSDEHRERVESWPAAVRRREELTRQERELLAIVRLPLPSGWVIGTGLSPAPRGARGDVFLRRGVVERVTCPAAAWVADGDALLAHHPIERVQFTTFPQFDGGEDAGLTGDPEGRQFSFAEIHGAQRPSDPDLTSFRRLIVSFLRLRYGDGVRFQLPSSGGS